MFSDIDKLQRLNNKSQLENLLSKLKSVDEIVYFKNEFESRALTVQQMRELNAYK